MDSIGQLHSRNFETIADETLHTHAEPQIDALLCMHGLHEIADGFTRHAGQHPRQCFDKDDFASNFAKYGSCFETDIAAANDDNAMGARAQTGYNAIDIGAAPNAMYPLEMGSWAAQHSRFAPRSPDKRPVSESSVVLRNGDMGFSVDRHNVAAQFDLDFLAVPELSRSDQQAFKRLIASEIFLR
ncbi:hypothetical protein GCM10010989_27700 [Croceicoccus pelagius]|uniref:Uncharacterized protein n=1 Tax=Croceicoccus pelagius TaxID=1703341 RepID=A0A916YMK6_9SPHN|nr:hypothetical protein GCM10010989_27700 [Croceicoccus pelagius]